MGNLTVVNTVKRKKENNRKQLIIKPPFILTNQKDKRVGKRVKSGRGEDQKRANVACIARSLMG